MRRTTVLIADDHAIVSEGLAALLTKHDFEVNPQAPVGVTGARTADEYGRLVAL